MTQDQGPHYTEYDSRLAAYAVVVDEQDRVLLALWNEVATPRWTLPGGGVDLRESIEDGAMREVREETGYEVELGRLLGADTTLVPPERRTQGQDRWLRSIRIVYEARVIGGQLRHEVNGTTDEARWIPLADVQNLDRVELVDIGLQMRSAPRC